MRWHALISLVLTGCNTLLDIGGDYSVVDAGGGGGSDAPPSPAYSVTNVVDAFDGSVTPGQTGYLRISLRNGSSGTKQNVAADLTTRTAGITIQNGTGIDFGDIPGGASYCGTLAGSNLGGSCGESHLYYPSIVVAGSVASGTIVDLELAVDDASAGTSVGFTFTID